MHYTQGGQQSIFFNFINSLSLWIGIFLLAIFFATPALASEITSYNIFELTNSERAKFNLNELKLNELLEQAAQQKASDIIEQQKFAHNFGDKKFSQWVKDEKYQYSIVGENLGINFDNTESLFNAWLASPTHKKNILNEDYEEIGVAIQQGEWYGEPTYIVVQIFGAPIIKGEQLVPAISEEKNNTTYSPLLTSNLSENYFTNITTPQTLFNSKNILEKKLSYKQVGQDKIAIQNYFLMAVQLMTIFTATMLLLMLSYLYLNYFIQWNKKLNLLNKP